MFHANLALGACAKIAIDMGMTRQAIAIKSCCKLNPNDAMRGKTHRFGYNAMIINPTSGTEIVAILTTVSACSPSS